MLRKIEPREDGRPNYQADEPKKAWDDFLGSLGHVARANPASVDSELKAKASKLTASRSQKQKPKDTSR